MDRNIFAEPFTRDDYPSWPCPHCNIGFLQIKNDKFRFEQTKETKEYMSHPDYDPTWDKYVYSAILECSHIKCRSYTMSVGTGYTIISDGMIFTETPPYENYFIPKFFTPPINIINIPIRCPDTVSQALIQSFELFFCNPSSCGNIIRISLEYLMTELSIATTDKNGDSMKLHNRILQYKKQNPKIADKILAIKWLGNTGSHAIEGLAHKDALDAYEILEHVLQELFKDSHSRINNMVSQINQNRGPIK